MIAVLVFIFFVVIAFNQVIALYNNINQVNHILAISLSVLVSLIFITILGLPFYAFLKYPKMAVLPDEAEGEVYDLYITKQLERLKKNKCLIVDGYTFDGESGEQKVVLAFDRLKQLSSTQIKNDANAIFLTTSISQNGVLDGATVLFTLMKMVYKVATIYETRPSMTRMIYLYGQIAAVVLIARTIEDLDLIEEQLEPILTSLLGGSVVSLVPGAASVTTLVVTSIVEGSVNALLTLRVGTITQRYLSAMTKVDKKSLRRGASLEAAGHLGSIIADNAKFIIKSFSHVTKKATVDKIKWPWRKSVSKG